MGWPSAVGAGTVQNPWTAIVYTQRVSVVTARVVVPTLSCAPNQSSALATWAGLDGWSDNTVEQVGFTFACSNGKQTGGAWYQLYPQPSRAINLPFRPNDRIDLQEQWLGGNRYLSKITDETSRQSASVTASLAGAQRSSAECVSEYIGVAIPRSKVAFISCVANGNVGLPKSHQQAVNMMVNGSVRSSQQMTSPVAFAQTFRAG